LSTPWFRLAAGDDCPFDLPGRVSNNEWDTVARLSVSTLCLFRNQAYRGHCILIYDVRHAARPDELTPHEWAAYCGDLHTVVSALVDVCRPDHVNVESLGNQLPHLHWHVIPRYRDDPRWGAAVWMTNADEFPRHELTEPDRAALIAALRARLARSGGEG
jgi:diadenosine tetraphosphate (Ap4A) HIT family hydrolase